MENNNGLITGIVLFLSYYYYYYYYYIMLGINSLCTATANFSRKKSYKFRFAVQGFSGK